jgi:hypothetical protein
MTITAIKIMNDGLQTQALLRQVLRRHASNNVLGASEGFCWLQDPPTSGEELDDHTDLETTTITITLTIITITKTIIRPTILACNADLFLQLTHTILDAHPVFGLKRVCIIIIIIISIICYY